MEDESLKYWKDIDQQELRIAEAMEMDHKDTYSMPRVDLQQDHLSKHQKSFGLSSIRDAVVNLFGRTRYSGFDKKVDMTKDRQDVDIHYDYGMRLADNGEHVIEIDCAGSEFKQFRNEYRGFHGKAKEKNPSRIKRVYGEAYKDDVRDAEGMYKKTMVSKMGEFFHKFMIPGPGTVDAGSDFTMDKIAEHVFNLGFNYAASILRSKDWIENPTKININLRGHSRGGVGETLGIQKIMEHLEKNFGAGTDFPVDYKQFVKINIIELDPVPGIDAVQDKYHKADLRSPDGSPNPLLNTTSVYSVHTEHSVFFKPMNVRGQSRIILMADKHGVGLDSIDASQKEVAGDEKYHDIPFFDSKTGEAYRGDGLNELPKGLFFRDENGAIVRMRSFAEAVKVFNKVISGSHLQHRRHAVLRTVMKNWFIDNEYVDETMTEGEIQKMWADMNDYSNPDSAYKTLWPTEDVKDSKEMAAVKGALANVYLMKPTDPEPIRIDCYKAAIAACKDYMEKKNPSTEQGKKRLNAVSEYLTMMRIELDRIQNPHRIRPADDVEEEETQTEEEETEDELTETTDSDYEFEEDDEDGNPYWDD